MTNDQQGSDLGAIFDAHVCAEFEQQDVDATMATMVDDPYLNHVPTMTGGTGGKGCVTSTRTTSSGDGRAIQSSFRYPGRLGRARS